MLLTTSTCRKLLQLIRAGHGNKYIRKVRESTQHYEGEEEGVAQWVERPARKPGAILTRVGVPCTARDFFPQSQLVVHIALWCLYGPSEQTHASAYVHTDRHTHTHTRTHTHSPVYLALKDSMKTVASFSSTPICSPSAFAPMPYSMP